MITLYCDTDICALPANSNEDRLSSFIEGLLLIKDLPQASWLRICISHCSLSQLFESGAYPARPRVEAALAAMPTPTIDAQDVVALINSVLKKGKSLEDELGVSQITHSVPGYTTPEGGYTLTPNTDPVFTNFIMLAAIDQFGKSPGASLPVITNKRRQLEKCVMTSSLISTDSHIELPLPLQITQPLFPIYLRKDYYEWMPIEAAWILSITQSDFNCVLNVAINKAIQAHNQTLMPSKWNLGSHFFSSLENLAICSVPSRFRAFIRAFTEAVLGLNLSAVHPLRTSRSGNASQIKSGRYNAWRRDIDYEYHLHYWVSEKQINFACVVPHNDFTIPSPTC